MRVPVIGAALALAAAIVAGGAALGAGATAEGRRYAVIVQGASGDPKYAELHRGWVDQMASVLRERMGFEAANVHLLTEQPRAGETRGTAEALRPVFDRLAKDTTADDLVFVMLIGHGSGDAAAAKFNLIGPDLTAAEWGAMLGPLPARVVFVNSTSSSFPFVAGLAGPNRIVITATNSYAQRFHTVFPGAFIEALSGSDADADKNGRISLLEAFTHASQLVARHYEEQEIMATEMAVINDTGEGTGRLASGTGPDGTIAGLTYLDVATVPKVADPELQRLLERQQALTEQVDALRRRQSSLSAEEFDREFEQLIIELAVVSRDVRRRSGG